MWCVRERSEDGRESERGVREKACESERGVRGERERGVMRGRKRERESM